MPLPTPKKGEKRNDFVSRCVSILSHKNEGDSTDQRVAICHSQYGKAKADETKEAFEAEACRLQKDLPKTN